jgi:hypothetical protein
MCKTIAEVALRQLEGAREHISSIQCKSCGSSVVDQAGHSQAQRCKTKRPTKDLLYFLWLYLMIAVFLLQRLPKPSITRYLFDFGSDASRGTRELGLLCIAYRGRPDAGVFLQSEHYWH